MPLCCMFSKVISRAGSPRYFSLIHDDLCRYYRWQANCWVLQIQEAKALPMCRSRNRPWNVVDPERKLVEFQNYSVDLLSTARFESVRSS